VNDLNKEIKINMAFTAVKMFEFIVSIELNVYKIK
jgi:hypothetical protein